MRLADPVEADDALFDLHGVPGQIEIDECVAELEVFPFATGLGREEDGDVPGKSCDLSVLFRIAHLAVKEGVGNFMRLQSLADMIQSLEVFDKDDLFFRRLHELEQGADF